MKDACSYGGMPGSAWFDGRTTGGLALTIMLRAATILSWSLAVLAVDTVDIYHRISHPDLPPSEFQLRGQVTLDSLPPALVASASSASDLAAFTEALGTYSSDPRTLYQIALGSSFEQISSVRYVRVQTLFDLA